VTQQAVVGGGPAAIEARLDRPVFIVGSARSGTTLLRTCFERSPDLWRLGRASKYVWEQRFHPLTRPSRDHVLTADDATDDVRRDVVDAFAHECFRPTRRLVDEERRRFLDRAAAQGLDPWYYDVPEATLARWFPGEPPTGPPYAHETGEIPPFTFVEPAEWPTADQREAGLRILDKDPGLSYRLPFLDALFPDARYLFVVRDGRAAVSSLIEAWRHPRWFFTYRLPPELRLAIPGYTDTMPGGDRWWNLQLPPSWEAWRDRPLEEVCAHQWQASVESMLADADPILRRGDGMVVRYEELVARPREVLAAAAETAQIDADPLVGDADLPQVASATPASAAKWRHNEDLIARILPIIAPTQSRLGYDAA
jgi:hypothetical protein